MHASASRDLLSCGDVCRDPGVVEALDAVKKIRGAVAGTDAFSDKRKEVSGVL